MHFAMLSPVRFFWIWGWKFPSCGCSSKRSFRKENFRFPVGLALFRCHLENVTWKSKMRLRQLMRIYLKNIPGTCIAGKRGHGCLLLKITRYLTYLVCKPKQQQQQEHQQQNPQCVMCNWMSVQCYYWSNGRNIDQPEVHGTSQPDTSLPHANQLPCMLFRDRNSVL